MDLTRYLAVLVVVFIEGCESGGHGEKHHDHVKLHMPEFIHHDHHTKVITIHHHHHKPKKEHHHHHHHHHAKPHVPHHHYNHHHHKTTLKTTTVSKGNKHHGHGHHGHHSHSGHHGHHTHHGHHGSHGHHEHHDHPYHHEPPSISYDPNPVTFEDEYKSFTPSVPVSIPHSPHVHGIVHTVKQVKVFDSLPGSLQGTAGGVGSNGYEVTEEGEEGDEDAFTSVNTIPQSYSGTYGFVRSAAPQPAASFGGVASHSTFNSNHDPFASAPAAFSGLENFSNDGQSDTFTSSIPTQGVLSNAHAPPEFASGSFNSEPSGFDDPDNTFIGNDIGGTALLSAEANDDTPVSFAREAGIQQTIKTGGVETVVY